MDSEHQQRSEVLRIERQEPPRACTGFVCVRARFGARLRRAVLLGAAALLAAPAQGEIVNRIVATVDGEPVTLYQLKQFATGDVRTRQAGITDGGVLLDALLTKRIIEKEVEAQGIAINETDIERYIASIRERNQLSEEQLTAALAQQGLTPEEYREQINEELQRAQLINREIRGKVNVTPEDVERYYQAHLTDYEKPPEITVSHIVLLVPSGASAEEVATVVKRAEAVHAQLEDGADFADLARGVSEDRAAESGGKLGTFQQGDMLEVLDQAVGKLEPGEYSGPIRSEVGIHIVRLDERSMETHQPLDSLAEKIKERLYNEALEERYDRWLSEELRERHHVEILP